MHRVQFGRLLGRFCLTSIQRGIPGEGIIRATGLLMRLRNLQLTGQKNFLVRHMQMFSHIRDPLLIMRFCLR